MGLPPKFAEKDHMKELGYLMKHQEKGKNIDFVILCESK